MNDDYDQVKPVVPIQIGEVVESISTESKGLKTTMRIHMNGFSVTRYRRTFQHNGQIEVPGTSQWHPMRHQEWLSQLSYDWLHSSQMEAGPTEPVRGDIDD